MNMGDKIKMVKLSEVIFTLWKNKLLSTDEKNILCQALKDKDYNKISDTLNRKKFLNNAFVSYIQDAIDVIKEDKQ